MSKLKWREEYLDKQVDEIIRRVDMILEMDFGIDLAKFNEEDEDEG